MMSIPVSVRFVWPWGNKDIQLRCDEGAKLRDALECFRKRRQELEEGCPESARKLLKPIMDQELHVFARSNMIVLNQKCVDVSGGGLDAEVSDGDEILVIPSIMAG